MKLNFTSENAFTVDLFALGGEKESRIYAFLWIILVLGIFWLLLVALRNKD